MSCRLVARMVLVVSLLLTATASAEPGALEPGQTAPAPSSPAHAAEVQAHGSAHAPDAAAAAPANSLARFELLLTVGYGGHTASVFDLELEPYGPSFGIEPGYSFAKGVRLGVYLDYGMGRSLYQQYQPRRGEAFQLTTEAWSLNTGASLAGELWLHFLILRYSLGLGLTWLTWDYGTPPETSLLSYATVQGSTFGFHLAPGLAVLWPIDHFEWGLGFDYFVQFDDHIPSGFVGKLLMGVKL